MKILVTYISKTGFTKEYAEIVAKNVGCDLVEFREMTAAKMSEYDVVVFGSRAHAGMVDGLKKAREMFGASGAKKLVLFCTGAAPCAAEDVVDDFWNNNLTGDEQDKLPHFYMQSGLRYEKMGFIDRTMMKAVSFIMSKQDDSEKTDYEKGFEQAISKSYDISDPKYAQPLIDCLKAMK